MYELPQSNSVWYSVGDLHEMMLQSAFDHSKFGEREHNPLTTDKSTSVRWFHVDEITTGIASGREEAGWNYGK